MNGIIDSMDRSLSRCREIAKEREVQSMAVELDRPEGLNNNKGKREILIKYVV